MDLLKKPNEILSKVNLKNIDQKKFKNYVLVFYAFLLISTAYHIVYAKRIIPGVKVAGVKIGGMNFSQAKQSLEENEKNITKELKLKYEDKEFIIRDEDISLVYDWESSVVRAFEVGRTGNILTDTKEKFVGLFKNLVTPASYDYDDDSLGIKFSIIRGEVNKEAQQSGVSLVDDGLEVIPSGKGRKVVEDKLYEIVVTSFDSLNFSERAIPVKVVNPQIVEKDVEGFLEEIKEIISEDIVLTFGEKKWILDPDQILELIEFEKDESKVKINLDDFEFDALAERIGIEINEFPKGQVVSTNGNIVTEFKIVKEGEELNVKKFENDLKESIFNEGESVTLTVDVVTDSTEKERYGILALLGEGTSHFTGSIPGRIHNLTLAAEKTSGVLVPPGTVYSMNDSVGPIDYQHGFQMAYIIQGNRTVLGSGGGVCQTSTTLFRAVLNSGLPVVARYPHAYRVGYYEQDMPAGFDAAVFQPSWDFKFKNDTNAYVLVQASANLEENSLTFKLYGTPDGRTVEITEPVITNQIAPPAPLYENDPTLAKGVVRQVDYSAWGATSSFTRTVKKGNEVLFSETFTSKFQPWRAIYKVGTKE